MTEFKPGSILINTSNNKLYGVLVTLLPNNKLIVFRLDKNTHPIFSKFQEHEHISKVGIINEYQYANLKNALLKYYRTYKLTPTEKSMLKPLMEFAFPIGIPEYQPHIDLPERDIQLMDLHSRIVPGARIFINTPLNSCYSHLNEKTIDVINKNEKGIWIHLPTGEQDITKLGNALHFLFYKNPTIPTFSGISRITPIIEDILPKVNDIIIEAFNKLKEQDSLTTVMQYNGEKIRVLPSSGKVIFPEIFQNMTYNHNNDTFIIDPSLITSTLASKLGDKLMITGKEEDNYYNYDSNSNLIQMNGPDNELIFNGGARKKNIHSDKAEDKAEDKSDTEHDSISKISSQDLEEIEYNEKLLGKYNQYNQYNTYTTIDSENPLNVRYSQKNIDDIDTEIDESIIDEDTKTESFDEDYEDISDLLNGVIKKNKKDKKDKKDDTYINPIHGNKIGEGNTLEQSDTESNGTTDIETDYDEDDIVEVFNEDDIEDLETFEKVKRVEVNELEKVYTESIQKGYLHKYKIEKLTNLEKENDSIINKITKHINIISILKHSITGKDNNIIFKAQDYKPLVSKYITGDFNNKFLIPLVINRKKIYLDKSKKSQKDEYDTQTHEVIDDYYGEVNNLIYLQNKKNVTLNNDTYTNNIINNINPTSTPQNDSLGILFRLGSEIPSNDYSHICQDTLTIRYCDKPFKCQSYSLNPMNFDYQVNLGPMGRFINKEEAEELVKPNDDDEQYEKPDKDILYSNPQFKTYYRGDTINIIGFVRPPLKYFESTFDPSNTNLLSNLYHIQKQHNEVITVNLEDIDTDETVEEQDLEEPEDEELEDTDDEESEDKDKQSASNKGARGAEALVKGARDRILKIPYAKKEALVIDKHPDNFVLYLLPQKDLSFKDIDSQIEKIIPSIDDLIKLYLNKKENNNIKHIYNILDKFEYNYQNITSDVYNKIIDKHQEIIKVYSTLNEKSTVKFDEYKKEVLKTTKEKESANKTKYSVYGKDDSKFKYITNAIMQDISKFYSNTYENKDVSVDSDNMRLDWITKQFDNGTYFFKTLFINYLKMYQESHNLENLETELSIIKEKYAMISNNQNQSTSNQSSTNPTTNSKFCNNKIISPNVIRYPSIERLEQDNGKVATDSDGNIIVRGDYALVNVNHINGSKIKQLFKREVIGNIEMWIKEDIGILYKLIQDKKNKCLANPEIDLEAEEDAGKCTFNIDNIKCDTNDTFTADKEAIEVELHMNNLNKEIEYIKNIPILIANVNKDIANDRLVLINKVNSLKSQLADKEKLEAKLEEENLKLRSTNKPCFHYNVTDYFDNIKHDSERYKFAKIILNKFENTELLYKTDYTQFNNEDNSKNYTFCNFCNQELICNHFRLGASYLEANKDADSITSINIDNIVNVFGFERNGTYYCNCCNESIDTTEILDFDEFVKGEDGGRRQIRTLEEHTPYIEKQQEYLDKMINNLIKGNQTIHKEELQQKINIFKLLKRLSNIDMFSIKDEIDMFTFLKTYQFTTRITILQNITKLYPQLVNNKALLKKYVDDYYMRYLISDIGARFLITLQTSIITYQISNKDCSPNIIGYPLINNLEADNGITYILCLFSQLAVLPEYSSISELQRKFFIDSLKKQVENDNFVKDKLFNALNDKSNSIDSINQFHLYNTNYWKQFTPRLGNDNTLKWSPEKMLNSNNLKELTHKTYERMVEVGQENCVYYSLQLINNINQIINNSDRIYNKELSNYCCMDYYNKLKKYNYIDFFKKSNSDVSTNINTFKEVNLILSKIKNKAIWAKQFVIYDPYYKPSQAVLPVNFTVSQSEIKDIYLKYIDIGLHKGKLHIYDKYNRCLLSNDKKYEIEQKSYSPQDYKRIESIINQSNNVILNKTDETIIDIDSIELLKIKELINECPKLDILTYFKDFIITIKDNYNSVSSSGSGSTKSSTNKFDIHRHLSNLQSQISEEIIELVKKLTIIEKKNKIYTNILNNLGDFTKQYEEFNLRLSTDSDNTEGNINYQSNLYRYNKKEEHIQYTLKFLNELINQIKNKKLSIPLNREITRPQFRDFLQFAENTALFNNLSKDSRAIYNFAKLIKSKNTYKLLFPEMTSSLLQYLNVISLTNLFNKSSTSSKRANTEKLDSSNSSNGELIDYNFKVNADPDNSLKELNMDMELGFKYNDEEEENQIESFEIKYNTNLKIITEFIIKYLEKISAVQNTYDELTPSKINNVVLTHAQKMITSNLKIFGDLAEQGNEELKKLVYIQMHKFKKINYDNLGQYLRAEHSDNLNILSTTADDDDELANAENDDYDGEDYNKDQDNDNYNQDNNEKNPIYDYNENENLDGVYDGEDNDDGDQDYGNLEAYDGDD